MEKRNNAAEGNVDEEDWNKLENSDLILHLTDTNFDYSLKKHEFVLVYYYKNGIFFYFYFSIFVASNTTVLNSKFNF